jgi:hypothetical protein|nr:phage tail tip lysozyme [Kofleriaceae bacterium]
MRSLPLLGLGLLLTSTLVACVADVPGEPESEADDGNPYTKSEAQLSSNEVNAFNYFISMGLTPVQSAGIVGNLMQESDVSPTVKQYGGGPGRGIAQWSVGGRWDTSKNDNVAWYASTHGGSTTSLDTQLGFIWYELTDIGYGYAQLDAATDVTTATLAFMDKYEICGACASATRIAYAKQVLANYTPGSGGGGAGSDGGGGGAAGGGTQECYSSTLGREMPANSCVQSKFDDDWFQCDNGAWVDRWTDPDACAAVYPL